MLSIQTVTVAKKSSILAALFLMSCVLSACSNKEKAAYTLGSEAQAQLDRGDIAKARLSIDKAIQTRDDLVELHLLKGRIELADKSLDAAFLSFYNAMSLDPVNQAALQAVAMLGLQTGHADEAESAAGKLLSLVSEQPTALLVKGLIALERKRFPEALTAADAILANAPTDESAVILKARALFLSGQREEAKALVERTINLSGNSAGFTRLMLEIDRAEGNAPGMLAAFARLRQLGQVDPKQVFDEANVRYKGGDRDGAAALIDAGLTDETATVDQREQLIQLWREYDPAAPAAGKLPRPKDARVREALARYLLERGRVAEANSILEGLDNSNARGVQARLLVAGQQTERARQLAEAVVATDPGQCDARVALAAIMLARNDTTAAVTNGQQAATECPTMADGWLITAQAYRAGGQPGQVKRVFRDAIAKDPDDLRLHSAFVDWLKQSGQGGEALAVARHLLRFTPSRISSWLLFDTACTDKNCRADAASGLALARATLVVDRRPGEVLNRGLFAALRTDLDCRKSDRSNEACQVAR